MRNTYIRTRRGGGVKPVDPSEAPRDAQRAYLWRCLAAMDADLGPQDLTVVLTKDLRHLEVTGPRVVCVVMTDEAAQVPWWADRVAVTFKTLGSRPTLVARPARATAALDALQTSLWAATYLRGIPPRLRHAAAARRGAIWDIPLGPYRLPPDGLAVRPPSERAVDVTFAGSLGAVARRGGLRGRIPSPRDLARARVVEALRAYAAERPDRRIDLHLTGSFQASKQEHPDAYWQRMAAARICLAPRGYVADTHRWFEGLLCGCAVVGERLPRTWFYAGAPTIDATGFTGLGRVLDALLDDPAALDARHRAGLAWWEARCAPAAVGRYMAGRVREALG